MELEVERGISGRLVCIFVLYRLLRSEGEFVGWNPITHALFLDSLYGEEVRDNSTYPGIRRP